MQHAFAHGINVSFHTAAARPLGPGPVHLHSLALNCPALASEPCSLPLHHPLLSSWGFRVRRPVTHHSALDDSRKWLPLSIQSPPMPPPQRSHHSRRPSQALQRFPIISLHPFSWQLIPSDVIALCFILFYLCDLFIFSLSLASGLRGL